MNRSVGIGTIKTLPQATRRKNDHSVSESPVVKFESEFCSFSGHLCRREKLQGHEFCLKHILEDKNSPFKQCNYVYRNQKRCTKAAPKFDQRDELCYEHSRQSYISKQKTLESVGPLTLAEHCIIQLEKYRPLTDLAPESLQESRTIPTLTKRPVDGSDDDDNQDVATVENAWKCEVDSDTESVESESENPLEHAGTYVAEEVMRIMRDKLILLQKLYINQFKRLRYVMAEERRAYRVARRRENLAEMLPIGGQPRDSIEEILAYEEAKAMSHYNKPQGLEAALHAELSAKRQKLSDNQPVNLAQVSALPSPVMTAGSTLLSQKTKCSYNLTSSTKCGGVCVPLSKFCIKHIMNDTTQVLFRTCGVSSVTQDEPSEDGPCETPIVPLFRSSTCVYHTNFSGPLFALKKECEPKFEVSKPDVNGKDVRNNDEEEILQKPSLEL